MTTERKFWNAVYKVIGETSQLAEDGYISDEDYSLIIQAVEQSIHRFREQQKEENTESGQYKMDGPTY